MSIVDFELLTAIEAHELNRLRKGAGAHSPNRKIALATGLVAFSAGLQSTER